MDDGQDKTMPLRGVRPEHNYSSRPQESNEMTTDSKNFCIILAGGRGRRLWPASRADYPKQFIDLFGTGRTQLQQTFDRFSNIIPTDHIYVTTNDEFEAIAREQLPMLPAENFIGEPINRNTAPSVTYGCYRILSICPEANVIITPSDQAIIGQQAFEEDVMRALGFTAENEGIIAMGIHPTRPEPGYGYVQMGESNGTEGLFTVQSFTEKPDRDFARLFMDSGEFLWNTGIFVSTAKFLLSHFKRIMPALFRQIEIDGRSTGNLKDEAKLVWEYFSLFPNLSVDYGVLEHAEEGVFVMLCDFGWADLGTWHSIYEAESRYKGDNVVLDSEVMMDNCRDNIIKLPKGHLGVISGLEGYIVVENENVLMVCKKGDTSAQIRKFLNEVQVKLGEEFI
jgi:mannose-1-phosphate guanylyltransferase